MRSVVKRREQDKPMVDLGNENDTGKKNEHVASFGMEHKARGCYDELNMTCGQSNGGRCFRNRVLQSGLLRGWSGSMRAEGTKLLENEDVFRHFARTAPFTSRGQESGKYRLESAAAPL